MITTGQLKAPSIQNQARPGQDVIFTRQQIEHLELVFPNVGYSPEVSEAKLRHANGQRSVLDHIKSRLGAL